MAPTSEKQENSSPVKRMEEKPLRTIQTARIATGGKSPKLNLVKKTGEKKKAQSAFHLWINDEGNREMVVDYYNNLGRYKKWHIYKKAGNYWHMHLAESVVNDYQRKFLLEKVKEEAKADAENNN